MMGHWNIFRHLLGPGLWAGLWLVWIRMAFVSPAQSPLASLLAMLLPLGLGFGLLCWVYALFRRRSLAWLWLLVLLSGWGFWRALLPFPFLRVSAPEGAISFRVLSYNVHVFNVYPHLQTQKPGTTRQMLAWLSQHPAEIVCLQEYYHLESVDSLATIYPLAVRRAYSFQTTRSSPITRPEGYFGLVILSRFPMLKSGDFPLQKQWFQRGVYADLLIGHDTLRVINVHLQSLAIDPHSVLRQETTWNNFYAKWRDLLRVIQRGNQNRASQIGYLKDFVAQSPHPVLITGDFNDLPWTYPYQTLRQTLYNAYENAGNSTGFTFRNGIPFLRIDHQFYDSQLACTKFKTYHDISFSDHSPIEGTYFFLPNALRIGFPSPEGH
ncbi:MAG: endonuclease/exonuclease/phosphatase family protein [Microscillaceae bacterium]|nr:endonuclease/exonuclease/phosphatase family protein [Microscillaceae bacterium]